jgi:Mg2+ and Co2+ transporter CorA
MAGAQPLRLLVRRLRAIFMTVADSAMLGSGCLPRLPDKGVPEMIIDCAHYQDGRRQGEGAVPLEEAAARCGQGGFVWLGLFEPGMEELAQVRNTFRLHELAVEDAQTIHMRPKVESYDGDVRLVILRTARYDDEAERSSSVRPASSSRPPS